MPGRQAERDAEGRADAEAHRDAFERRRQVDPERASYRHVEHVAEHEPGTRHEDRVEELQHHDGAREQAPERQERGDGAEAQRERTPARQSGAAKSRVHQLGHTAQESGHRETSARSGPSLAKRRARGPNRCRV